MFVEPAIAENRNGEVEGCVDPAARRSTMSARSVSDTDE
jgi:hypothetical protein